MKNKQFLWIAFMLGLVTLLAGACIRPPETGSTPATATPAATETPAASATVSNTAEITATMVATTTSNAATATVNIASLRVRVQPNNTSTVVSGIKQGETYNVIGLSSDGLWVELAIPKAPGGKGWVSANFVTVKGSITDTNITNVGQASSATPTTTQALTETTTITPSATTTPTVEPTVAPTVTSTMTDTMTATPAVSTTVDMTATPATADITTTTAMTLPVPASGMAVVNTPGARLRVRSEPKADAPVVGYAYHGEQYAVVGMSDDKQWVQLAGSTTGRGENPNGGWVAAQFVIVGQ